SGKAAMLARENRAAADGLTRSRAVFARSSYLCVGYKACGQAGMGSGGYAAVSDKMYWRMYSGHNCTNYAAYRMVHSGLPNQRPWSGGGNATYWGTSVPTITDRTPAVGAVAWWKANTGPAGSAGHVAYVEKVVDSDEIIISQDSWGGDFSWAVVTKASGNWPSGFIHFNDLKLVNKAAPVVSGVAKVGATLTASPGTWNPTDAKVSYQWFANGVAIPSATKSTLALSGSLLGDVIKVRTTAAKAGYAAKAATSAATSAVLPGVLSSTRAPVISGTLQVQHVLSLETGAWNVAPDSTSVQWYVDGQPIAGATVTKLRLTPDLAGRAISAAVVANRAYYDPITVWAPTTAAVAPGTLRTTRAPAVSGTAKPGQVLTVDPGAYRPTDATTTVQWLRDGQPVLNATGPTYQVTAVDLGAQISASVTVSRAGFTAMTLTTPHTAPVRVTPRIRVQQLRGKHAVRLTIRVTAPYVSPVDGTVVVRVQGGFRKVVQLRHGVARVRIVGMPKAKRALSLSYRGNRTVAAVARKGIVRTPGP
ncbi:CHAP domain-containing protein, partial [Nocardioides hankookensis]